MDTGFIGLGMMGNPMAQNLLKAGQGLTVFDLRPEAVQPCARLGATVAESIAQLAACEVVFIIVNTSAQLNEVLFADDGLVHHLPAGEKRTIVVMSTVAPAVIKAAQERIDNRDITLIDAPVSGGPLIAESGQLSFMIGGADAATMDRLRPALEAMGKDIFTIGGLGTGLAVKLINNIVALGNAYVFTQALGIGAAAGLDIERVVEVMSASSGKNWCTDNWEMYKAFMGLILAEPDFQKTAEKDIATAIEWSVELGLDIPALQHVRAIVESSAGIPDQLKATIFSTS
ncbi:MAG: NAD(P)-dependent oxidoreductase [Halieaceae bacterium]|nr:NAD(P)-dependent oxidoreductase [Halieaceae bacterium]